MSDEPSLSQLIVIGSSAGGIEALATLVSTLPTPFPSPILVAQHLDPSRPSHLGEILARRSPIPVVTVHQNEHLTAGTVYVVPSNHNIEITDHDITLLPDGAGRPKPSIDLLLSTASQIYGEQLIAVILTGTGSDGAMGARAVKEAGGTIVVQNPDTAAFPGMPLSIEPHIVDIVADLPRIGPILFDLLTGVAVPPLVAAERDLAPFLQEVHEYTGIDFGSYKPATILRRLQRRILAAGTSDLAAYKEYLAHHPDEYHRLASSFLIKVTDFMRDQELFDMLRERVIPELVEAGRKRGKELRMWSAGCATGQEAYSLAILVMEALGDELPDFSVKIFATDLDNEAVAFARHGHYPPGTLAHVPEDLVARYFKRSEAGYEVKKQVRSLVVFGEHNLADRAPFPRIDLVLCRNVLIYFTRDLQQRALQMFAFSLREGGYLVLGKTETVSPAADFFAPELSELKIYRRHGRGRPMPPFQIQGHGLPFVNSISRSEQRLQGRSKGQRGQSRQVGLGRELFAAQQESLQARMFKENLLFNLPIGVVVVDRHYDIQEINNAARQLLGIHTVAIGDDLLHLAHNVPNKPFRAAIDKAFREKTTTKLNEVQAPQMATGEPTYLRIECYPQPQADSRRSKTAKDDGADLQGGEDHEDGPTEVVENVLVLVTNVTDIVGSKQETEQGTTLLRAQTEELRVANQTLAAGNEESARSNTALETARHKAEELAARHAQQVEELAKQNRKLSDDHQEARARHIQQIEVLSEANRDLLAANQEMARANAGLRIALDEFLITNEEAQAAVEEIETLNEEMQATNEELETLNEELQATVEELNTSNSDLAARGDELQSLALSLEVQKAQLEAILSGLADAVLVVTQEGNPLLMNAAYKRLFGDIGGSQASQGVEASANSTSEEPNKWGKEAALFTNGNGDGKRRRAMLMDEQARPLLPSETPHARAALGETFSMTFALAPMSGGELRYFEAVGQPVIADNEQKWGVVVIRDITDRNLRVMQEQFTALASHELRTPLTVIKGYLQILAHSLKKQEGNEQLLHFVQTAVAQTNRQMRLIEDLLDVARIQTGKFSLRCEPLRLDIVLERAVEIGQVMAKGQKIELMIDDSINHTHAKNESDVGDQDADDIGASLLVNGDATRLEQAILNLVNNAITHTPGSARIDVRLCRADDKVVHEEVGTAMAEINVQDYGKGIPAKDLPYMFTRFYQVGEGNPLSTQGLGLGLFITRQIVEAHGGTIAVESVEGEGTTFIIRLPLLEHKADFKK